MKKLIQYCELHGVQSWENEMGGITILDDHSGIERNVNTFTELRRELGY